MANGITAEVIRQLRSATVELRESPYYQQIVVPRDQVLARFQPIFSLEHVPTITADEFWSFLHFENNQHWTGLQRQGSTIGADMAALRRGLSALLAEDRQIAERFNRANDVVHGMGKNILSAILLIAHPDKYGVWNRPSEAGMKKVGVWPEFDRGESLGNRYAKINRVLLLLRDALQTDLWTLDALWYFLNRKKSLEPDPEPERNPNWARDELILALDLYRRHQGNPPGKNSKHVIELSRLLNKMGPQLSTKSDFRNPNGVYMKVMNFRRFDPVYVAQGKKGLERGGKLEAEVWSDFVEKPNFLADTANAIRAVVEAGSTNELHVENDGETFEAEEGRILARVHLTRERNRKLVELKKMAAINEGGKLRCEVCCFDFEAAYGERGAGFIEVHHLRPIHTLRPGEKTKLEDLALLCSNCHRMIHARKPWLTVEQLRRSVQS